MRKRLRKLHMKDKQINEDTLGEAGRCEAGPRSAASKGSAEVL